MRRKGYELPRNRPIAVYAEIFLYRKQHAPCTAPLFVTGLFHNVIAQSGVATAPYSVYSHDEGIDFRQYVRDVGDLFSCHGQRLPDVIACLRQVSQHDIIAKRGNVHIYTGVDLQGGAEKRGQWAILSNCRSTKTTTLL